MEKDHGSRLRAGGKAVSAHYTPFSLHEYLSGMLADSIKVVEDRLATTARVDLRNRVITIPAIDYSRPMTEASYRVTKSFVDHESAHLLFTPSRYNKGLSCFPENLRQLINLMEDVRIERLYSRRYQGIAEDLLELNRKIFRENLLDGIETDQLQSMLSLIFAYSFHVQPPEGRHFNPTTEAAFYSRIRPLLDPFNASTGLHPEKPAQKIHDILRELYGRRRPSPEAREKMPTEPKGSTSGGSQAAHPTGGSDMEAPSDSPTVESSLESNSAKAESDPPPVDSPDFDNALNAGLKRADTKEYLERRLPPAAPSRPAANCTIEPYLDRIIRIPVTEIPTKRRFRLHDRTVEENFALIASYRALFSSTLVSIRKTRTYSTFSGRFDSRHASRTVTSLSPRVFTQKVPGVIHSYDVSILLDISASMKSYEGGSEPKILTASKAMIVLAEALKGLPRISFEVLAFTADNYLDLVARRMLGCSGDNVVYELKSFSEKRLGIIPTFYDAVREYELCAENFDLAAIKVASARLLRHRSGNRKLLIVLSDGTPCCRNNASVEVLRDYIRHVATRHPIFGIGIANPYIGQLYPHAVNVCDLTTLGSEVLTTIRRFLLATAHSSTVV